MTTARERILGEIRRSLGRSRVVGDVLRTLETRLLEPRRNLVPSRSASLSRKERIELFVQWAEAHAMTVTPVSDLAMVPSIAADAMRVAGARTLRVPNDPVLRRLPWAGAELERLDGNAAAEDDAGINVAFCAIAETGTLVVTSGPGAPTGMSFIPPLHFVVVLAEQIVPAMEDAWSRIRLEYGAGRMPRCVNFITGTSLTGDIAATLIRGAHGPLAVHVLLVDV